MSESGTKKGRRLACANDSAGGPNGLKQCRSGGRKGWNCLRAAAPRDPLLQLSSIVSLSPDWHCENIHPGRYSVAANGSYTKSTQDQD